MSPSGTHEVLNQSTPWSGANLFDGNRALQDALAFHLPAHDSTRLAALGREAGSAEMQTHARLANLHKPQLHSHDRFGHRVDLVEFHPSYHVLLGAALRHGLHGTPWQRGPGSHIERAAAFMLFTELEPSVLCPVSMTYAVTPTLRANPALHAAWGAGLAATQYDPRFAPAAGKSALTVGMGMTEKQGGSDVRANTTAAVFDGDTPWGRAYRLTGHKWFMSAPMCDAFLVLAQAPGGLSCFFVPRWRPDGSANPIRIQRLKDKLGNHANASSEVEFDGQTSGLAGRRRRPRRAADPGHGRPDAARLRARHGRPDAPGPHLGASTTRANAWPSASASAEQPLMKNVLADLAIESEAATALALRLARAIDASEQSDAAHERVRVDHGHEAVMRRVLTPIAKFWVCKRGAAFAQEAMECLGGNGYVEEGGEGVMARIYREMPLNSIWEGAGNIMALDLLRALRGADVTVALAQELAPARGDHAAFDRLADTLPLRIDGDTDEAQARSLARDIALLVQAALLRQHSTDAVFAAFCSSRLAGAADVFGLLPAGTPFDALLERALPH